MIRNLAKFVSTNLEQVWPSKYFSNHFRFQLIKNKMKNHSLKRCWASPDGLGSPRLRAHMAQNDAAQHRLPLSSGDWQMGPARQREETGDGGRRRRGSREICRWRVLRWTRRHRRAPHHYAHPSRPSFQPLPYPSNDGVSNGGRQRDRCGAPATANSHCHNQAWHKLY